MRLTSIVLVAAALALGSSAGGAELPEHELAERVVLYEGEGGASCAYFLGDVLAWQRRGGDWRDARGRLQGDQPYDTATAGPTGAEWEITALVRKWLDGGAARGGVLLHGVGGSGYAVFRSREAPGAADWPMLVLEYGDGRREILKPAADTFLDCSTYRSLGRGDTLSISGQQNIILQFRLPAGAGKGLARARLVLSSAGRQGGALRVGAFELAVPAFPNGPVQPGLAASYPGDQGIEANRNVIFASGFDEGGSWRSKWARDSGGEMEVVSDDRPLRFAPLSGSALRVFLRKGVNLGADLRLNMREHGGEPEELYFRYYLRLADDWNPNKDGGKMPGMGGTYGIAGWGGRRSDGTNGWSLRGSFLRIFEGDHPMHGLTQLATYAYHADMPSAYGDHWGWPGALLERNRWYCIEQHVRLNRPDAADGLMQVWIDGRLSMERSNIRLRTVDRLRIENVWLNVYHGGIDPSPHDQHLFIDNVVVARSYIGPMGGAGKSASR